MYVGAIRELALGVMGGLNGTVFAYGATGSGKTHTMVGEWGLSLPGAAARLILARARVASRLIGSRGVSAAAGGRGGTAMHVGSRRAAGRSRFGAREVQGPS